MLMIRIASDPGALSMIRPMTGSTRDTENMPSPPMIDRPKAPLCGRFSEMNDNVVGQKNVIPSPNTPAAMKTKSPVAVVRSHSPANEKTAENSNAQECIKHI